MSFDSSTSGSRSSGDPAVVWAVMSAVTARNQSLLTPRSHRPGARRLIAGRTAVSALLPSQPPWLNLLSEDTQVIPRLLHYGEDWRSLFTAGVLQWEEECQHRPSSAGQTNPNQQGMAASPLLHTTNFKDMNHMQFVSLVLKRLVCNELTQSTEKRSQFNIILEKKKRKKRNQVKHFILFIQNNGMKSTSHNISN